jgi:hypothetical protein
VPPLTNFEVSQKKKKGEHHRLTFVLYAIGYALTEADLGVLG